MYLIFRSVLFENERDQRVDRHTCIPSKAARMRALDPSELHARPTHTDTKKICASMRVDGRTGIAAKNSRQALTS